MGKLLLIYFSCLALQQTTFCSAQQITVNAGEDVALPCTSVAAYPVWIGPEVYSENRVQYNNPGNSNFASPHIPPQKKARLAWDSDNKGLIIKNVTVTDSGLYQCSDKKIDIVVRVPPNTPLILNTESPSNNKIIRASESMETKLVCVSTGGYPEPRVDWYRKSTGTQPLISTSTVNMGSNSFNVTKTYTFSPERQDDGVKFICQSSFQTEPKHTSASNVELLLNLKPNKPTVEQTSAVAAGNTVVVRCETTGSRPAANITWWYRNTNLTDEVTTTLDDTTQTYTVVSLLRRHVTAEDNGLSVQCKVSHTLLVEPPELITSVKLNVRFSAKASTTTITGNKVIAATGSTPLPLNCTTGSSNPASDMVWMNKSAIIDNSRQYKTWTGENNGIVRSQELVLYPTRYMDGDVITCSVSNVLNPQSSIIDTATLNLNYSPIVTIEGQQHTFTEGERKELFCKVDSKPKATITWYHGDTQISEEMPVNKILIYSLEPVKRSHYGDYRCKANNGIDKEDEEQISVYIKFKPLTTTISGNNIVIANGRNTLTLTCISGSSNPISDITWKISTEITKHTGNPAVQNGDYGGMKRSRTLTVTPTRDNDGDNISCEANNTIGTSISSAILDLKYRPLIKPMSDVIAVEGNKTVMTCTASSKPASTFKWYRGQSGSILHQGTGTLGSNTLKYTISNVRRTDAATYRCNADNSIETADDKNVVLTVYYPPDVTPLTTNTSVKNKTAVITCNAKGVPDKNYRYGQWEQRWLGYDVPVSKKNGSEKLLLSNLTYEHSGVYTCSASNGIRVFGTEKEFMEGSVHLLVKSFPIVTNSNDKTSARLNGNATFEVYYYSNIEVSAVKIYRTVNKSRQKEVIYNVSESSVEINLPVFTHIIKTVGTRAQIMIQIHSKEDLGFYAVNISNEIGSSTRSFEIVPEGPPSNPYNVTVDILQYNKARLSWIRGYHGGFAQTFVIQMSTDLKNWKIITVSDGKNESEEPISKDLLDLHDSTTYYIQMYAFNSEGNSSSTENLNFTTLSKIEDTSGMSAAVIGGAAGGGSALILIILVTVVVFILKRRGVFTKGKGNSHDDKTDRKPVYSDENDDGMQDNPMYVSAGPREQTPAGSGSSDAGAVYSTVDKKKLVVDSRNNDVYAEVDKSKKTNAKQGKKAKTEKTKHGFMKDKKGKKVMQEGDLYENATTTEMKDRLAKQNKNDETIYENPEPSKQAEKKNVNKDGLIYADLTFNDQPKGQKKLVIHGLDSMTEYVEVDFTKKADPLPDSDDENNSPKK